MTGSVLRYLGYRFRVTLRPRLSGYLGLALLLGVVGGVAMGTIAGARRTQSSFPTYLASTNPSDVELFTEFLPISGAGYSPKVARVVARDPGVRRAAEVVGFDGTLQVLGHQGPTVPGEAPPAFEGSTNGYYTADDKVTLLRGRLADPHRLDEMVMSRGAAAEEGLHLGSTLPVAFFTDAQVTSPNYAGYPTDRPELLVRLKLVGIVEAAFQVVQDDDGALGNQFAVLTPALTRRLENCCAYYSYVALQLRGGARHVAAVVASVRKHLPYLGSIGGSQTDAPYVAKAEGAIRPEAIAWAVFGVLAALATLLICAQVVSRLVRRSADDGPTLRALGASPAMTVADGLVGIVGAVIVGAVLAVGVAVALSPLAPIGPVRSVYPDPGVAFDWTVLGFGFLVLVAVLSSAAVVMAYRLSPHRLARRTSGSTEGSSVARAASASGLSPAAVTGIRSALGLGSGRGVAPVRSALFGAVLAVVVVVTSITFGASLNALVSRPSLYGWNWNYALLSGFSAAEDLPAAETATLLNRDQDVGAWSGVYFTFAFIDGLSVPVLASSPNAPVGPPILSGHALAAPDEVVLGSATLRQLHKQVGDVVTAVTNRRTGARIRLRIVGTATLPTIGGSGSPNLQMGTGAVMSPSLFPRQALNEQGSAVPGPNAALITIKKGVSGPAALRSLQQVTRVLNRGSDPDGPVGGVVAPLRPAAIADYHTLGSTPFVLAGVLAAGAVVALGLTLVASVRSRRREFALLKALGFTERQLASTVGWQASVAAVVGVVAGVPIGVALGRWLWTLFAQGISAVPYPTVPAGSVVIVALGAFVFANLVAMVPGRLAARTPTALLLRAE